MRDRLNRDGDDKVQFFRKDIDFDNVHYAIKVDLGFLLLDEMKYNLKSAKVICNVDMFNPTALTAAWNKMKLILNNQRLDSNYSIDDLHFTFANI